MPKKSEARRSSRTPPRFCPGCGAELRDTDETRATVAIGEPTDGKATLEPGRPWGWDCYCVSCGWNGDISPDERIDDAAPPKKNAKKKPAKKKPANKARKPLAPPAPPEHTWTDEDRLTYEEFTAGEACRNCGRPFFGGPEWVAIMHRTPDQAAALDAEEAEFKRLHPDCDAMRWSISGGGITHCARCCAPFPLSPEQSMAIARLLLDVAREQISEEKAAKEAAGPPGR